MSSVFKCDVPENCKPWHAPELNIKEEVAFDYKLTDPENVTHRDQQTKIRQQAYEKSYARGYMEGLQKGQQEITSQIQNIHSIMSALTMPLPELDNLVVDEMVQVCIVVVKQMVRRELKISPDEVIAVIQEALNALPDSVADVTLELNPADAALVRSSIMNPDSQAGWKIVEDPVMTCGGCRVLTKTSRIDATVENRLNAVVAEVFGNDRKNSNNEVNE